MKIQNWKQNQLAHLQQRKFAINRVIDLSDSSSEIKLEESLGNLVRDLNLRQLPNQ